MECTLSAWLEDLTLQAVSTLIMSINLCWALHTKFVICYMQYTNSLCRAQAQFDAHDELGDCLREVTSHNHALYTPMSSLQTPAKGPSACLMICTIQRQVAMAL